MKVIGYARVSTELQADQGDSLPMQQDKIRAYCNLNDLELVQIVSDKGISAKNIKGRPGFQRALDLIFSGKAHGIVVWKLDRAFRSTQDALAVAERMNKKGKTLHSICEKLDTSSAIGEFFFTLMASLAQMERRLIGERTSAVLQAKKARGECVGTVPYGMERLGTKLLAKNPAEQQTIETIAVMRDQGRSWNSIATMLNDTGVPSKRGGRWDHTSVKRVHTANCSNSPARL